MGVRVCFWAELEFRDYHDSSICRYFGLCLVCNINLEPESEQTKKGTTGTKRYIQLHSLLLMEPVIVKE